MCGVNALWLRGPHRCGLRVRMLHDHSYYCFKVSSQLTMDIILSVHLYVIKSIVNEERQILLSPVMKTLILYSAVQILLPYLLATLLLH